MHKIKFALTLILALLAAPLANAQELKLSSPYKETSFQVKALETFATELGAKIYPDQSLVKHNASFDAVRNGQVDFAQVLLSRFGKDDSLFEVDSIPFLAPGYNTAKKLWEFTREPIEKRLADQGLKLLLAVPWPPQMLYSARPITDMSDFRAMKLRSYNDLSKKMVELLGAKPIDLSVTELQQAVKNKKIDGFITSPTTGYTVEAWNSMVIIYRIDAWLPKNVVVMSLERFNALPIERQNQIMAAAENAESLGWSLSKAETVTRLETLQTKGISVSRFSPVMNRELQRIGNQLAAEWQESANTDNQAILRDFMRWRRYRMKSP